MCVGYLHYYHKGTNEKWLAQTLMALCVIDTQAAPAGIHRQNAAERAIYMWKNHFLTLLYGINPNFPMKLWDTLIP